MAKSTNHTAHNQSYKNHRNGIKKPGRLGKGQRRSCKGVRPPCSNTWRAVVLAFACAQPPRLHTPWALSEGVALLPCPPPPVPPAPSLPPLKRRPRTGVGRLLASVGCPTLTHEHPAATLHPCVYARMHVRADRISRLALRTPSRRWTRSSSVTSASARSGWARGAAVMRSRRTLPVVASLYGLFSSSARVAPPPVPQTLHSVERWCAVACGREVGASHPARPWGGSWVLLLEVHELAGARARQLAAC
jgi:hypothetical protein